MIHNLLFTFLCVLSGLFLLRCQPPVVEPDPAAETLPSWQLHPEVRLDRRLQMHAQVAGDSLWLLGNNYLLCLDADHRVVVDELVAPLGNALWYRSFLSLRFFATELNRQHQFELRLNRDPSVKARVNLRALDSSTQEINAGYNQPMAINDRGQLLVAGLIYGERTGVPLFLMEPSLIGDSLSMPLIREIWLETGYPGYATGNRINGIYAFGDTFYFSMSGPYQFYRLLPGGEPEVLFPLSLAHVFWVHDTLTAIGYDREFDLNWYHRSPSSHTWQGVNLGEFDNGYMRYESVQDRVICYWRAQLWELTHNRDFSQVYIQELNNQGLTQLIIHDVAVFQDRVYLCTSRGLYYQPLADFFTYQPTE